MCATQSYSDRGTHSVMDGGTHSVWKGVLLGHVRPALVTLGEGCLRLPVVRFTEMERLALVLTGGRCFLQLADCKNIAVV